MMIFSIYLCVLQLCLKMYKSHPRIRKKIKCSFKSQFGEDQKKIVSNFNNLTYSTYPNLSPSKTKD